MSEHTQVGPYALGLLDPVEMSRFEEHLAECDECGTQLEWMLPVADFLADVEPGDLFGIDGPSAFASPGGSVQQSSGRAEPPTGSVPQAPPAAPQSYTPLRELQSPQYPDEISPAAGPRSGEIPRADPRTGNISRVDPRTGSIPRVDPRTGSIPRVDPRTGEMPMLGAPTGENRIVPLVRGGDSRRRPQTRASASRPPAEDYSGRFRPALLIAAAAAVLGAAVGAGAVVAGPWANSDTTQPSSVAIAGGLSATDAETGVTAKVGLSSKAWGTLVSFTVSELDGPRKCQLVAVLGNGKSEVLSTWTVPEQGYSEGTVPPELTLQASTATNRRDISSFKVQDVTQPGTATTLVTVPA
jgi:hypothetical protein